MDTYTYNIIAILATMVLSAFFSGMEIAFVASNRLLMKVGKDQSGLSQHCLKVFYANPNSFVSTMLVGNNIVLVVYGILFARIFDGLWQLAGISNDATLVMLDSICSTLVILFTGEFLPKTLFKSNPNRLMSLLAPVAYLFYIVLWPISRFSTLLSRLFLRLLGVKMEEGNNDGTFTKVDLDDLVQSSIDNTPQGGEVDDEMKIFQNALDFPDLKVRDCMVPRTEINAVPYDCTADELQQKFVESGNSKILIYKEDIDHIVGYIHTLELFRAREKWHDHIRQMPFVPETMAAQKLMQIFLGQKKSIGVVVDEFGGTSGIVSLEDIVEEIFGDIEDEHDNTNYIAKQTADGDYILSGRLEIDKANELFNLGLPDSGEYKTISGLILHAYQSFPKLNEVVKVGKYHFKIVKKTMTKIEVVRLHVAEE
ncbi:MAG: hemolysin family protein [Prevotella sp.]|uniref:hemolysin family protein n=1 Tax=Prevotella sp. TaxID=59823 RepID=UPI003A3EB3AC